MSSRHSRSSQTSRRSSVYGSANERAVKALRDAGSILSPHGDSYYDDEDRYSRASSVLPSDSSSSTERYHGDSLRSRPSRRSRLFSGSHSDSQYSGSEASSSSYRSGSSRYSRAISGSHSSSRMSRSSSRERISPMIEHAIGGDGFDSSDEEQIALSWARTRLERFGSRPVRENTRLRYEDFYDPSNSRYRTGVPSEAEVLAAAYRIGTGISGVRRGSDDLEESLSERSSRLSVSSGSHYGGSRAGSRASLYGDDSDDGSQYGDSRVGRRVRSYGRGSDDGSHDGDNRIDSCVSGYGRGSDAESYRGSSRTGRRISGYGSGSVVASDHGDGRVGSRFRLYDSDSDAGSYVSRNIHRSSRYG